MDFRNIANRILLSSPMRRGIAGSTDTMRTPRTIWTVAGRSVTPHHLPARHGHIRWKTHFPAFSIFSVVEVHAPVIVVASRVRCLLRGRCCSCCCSSPHLLREFDIERSPRRVSRLNTKTRHPLFKRLSVNAIFLGRCWDVLLNRSKGIRDRYRQSCLIKSLTTGDIPCCPGAYAHHCRAVTRRDRLDLCLN